MMRRHREQRCREAAQGHTSSSSEVNASGGDDEASQGERVQIEQKRAARSSLRDKRYSSDRIDVKLRRLKGRMRRFKRKMLALLASSTASEKEVYTKHAVTTSSFLLPWVTPGRGTPYGGHMAGRQSMPRVMTARFDQFMSLRRGYIEAASAAARLQRG